MTKTWTCQGCGYRNPEWASECAHCAMCSFCGEILPTADDPVETFRLREPHRETEYGRHT